MSDWIARWLDGHEETVAINRYDELAAQWADQRDRGAIELLEPNEDGTRTVRDHGFTEARLAAAGLRPGNRVKHKRTGLVGRVVGFEYHSQGRLSAMPLKVYWDSERASDELGWFAIYPSPESLEVLETEVPA